MDERPRKKVRKKSRSNSEAHAPNLGVYDNNGLEGEINRWMETGKNVEETGFADPHGNGMQGGTVYRYTVFPMMVKG